MVLGMMLVFGIAIAAVMITVTSTQSGTSRDSSANAPSRWPRRG